jgi:hypothetical protein
MRAGSWTGSCAAEIRRFYGSDGTDAVCIAGDGAKGESTGQPQAFDKEDDMYNRTGKRLAADEARSNAREEVAHRREIKEARREERRGQKGLWRRLLARIFP